nr:hypothetical protein [Labilibacter marinus]
MACNLKQAKSVGLIFNSTIEKDRQTIKKIESDLKDLNIKVEVMGFSPLKPNGDTLIGDTNHHYIGIKDFNWFYKPKNELIAQYTNNSFDILIDLYQEEQFEHEYILKTSLAKFKVGCAHLDKGLHDLMIDVGDKKGNSVYLSEQINHYLSVLNC